MTREEAHEEFKCWLYEEFHPIADYNTYVRLRNIADGLAPPAFNTKTCLAKCMCGADPVIRTYREDSLSIAMFAVECVKCGMQTKRYFDSIDAENTWNFDRGYS